MATIEVNYFNSFMLNRLVDSDGDPTFPSWVGGNPIPDGANANHWYVEESRIRGGYNNVETGYGVKAYIVENQPESQVLSNGLIYSGVFNSRTGFNESNQFSVGSDITKSVDPANGSIQKLYAEDTNLIVFQEDKVSRALIDKDAIYSAEGGGSVTSTNLVIGQIVPYAGEFGISKNPESFAVYGYRKYFTDIRRNAVLRLSSDGLTEISNYGMKDYFRDKFNDLPESFNIIGSFDIHNKVYVTSLQQNPTYVDDTTVSSTYDTLYFDDSVNGWVSFLSFKPTLMGSLRNKFFTFYNGGIWMHYSDEAGTRGNFYNEGVTSSSISFIFNGNVSLQKVFQTVSYEGSNGWEISTLTSDQTGFDDFQGEWKTYQDKSSYNESRPAVYSYDQGAYVENNIQYRVGFDRKENKYHAVIKNNSEVRPGEVVFNESISGIKGFFANVTIKTDSVTDTGNAKELFAVSTNYKESSY